MAAPRPKKRQAASKLNDSAKERAAERKAQDLDFQREAAEVAKYNATKAAELAEKYSKSIHTVRAAIAIASSATSQAHKTRLYDACLSLALEGKPTLY